MIIRRRWIPDAELEGEDADVGDADSSVVVVDAHAVGGAGEAPDGRGQDAPEDVSAVRTIAWSCGAFTLEEALDGADDVADSGGANRRELVQRAIDRVDVVVVELESL